MIASEADASLYSLRFRCKRALPRLEPLAARLRAGTIARTSDRTVIPVRVVLRLERGSNYQFCFKTHHGLGVLEVHNVPRRTIS